MAKPSKPTKIPASQKMKAAFGKVLPLFEKLKPVYEKLQAVLRPIENYVFSKNKVDIIVGVKIGNSNIVAVEVERKTFEYKILNFDVKKIPRENPKLSELLAEMLTQSGFSKETINTSLSGSDVIVRFIQYPMMGKKELKESISYEAEKYIPFNLADVITDYVILEEKAKESKKFYSLALVAAKRDAVLKTHGYFKAAGLALNAVDVDAFPSSNLFQLIYPEDVKQTVALVNIGSELTNITILHHGKPAFTRDLVFGGSDITKKIAKKMKIDFEKAEEFKANIDPTVLEAKKLVKESVSYLIDELKLSFNFFVNQVGEDVAVGAIYLSGGTSQLGGLSDILKEALKIDAAVFDPMPKFSLGDAVDRTKLKTYSGSLAVPLGLAIRG